MKVIIMPNTSDILKYLYTSNFGSKRSLFQEAKAKYPDEGMTYKDVHNWTEENLSRLQNLKGQNPYIAREAKQVYQIDSFYYNFEQLERVIVRSGVTNARKSNPMYPLIPLSLLTCLRNTFI